MFRPYTCNWIQPIGVFATHGSVPGQTLSQLVLECILLLEKQGAEVVSVVCDGAQNNKSMWNQFGISGKKSKIKNKIPHPCAPSKRNIFFLCDVPHIIKCIRNHIMKMGTVQVDGKLVSFKFYQMLFEEDSKRGDLRVASKLTQLHVNPNCFQKMNVRLATQLFSKTTADAIKFYRDHQKLKIFQESEETECFTKIVNDIFDDLNAKFPAQGIRPNSSAFERIKDFIALLDCSEEKSNLYPSFVSTITAESLRVTLKSVLDIADYLFAKNYKYILTAKLNQDCLEIIGYPNLEYAIAVLSAVFGIIVFMAYTVALELTVECTFPLVPEAISTGIMFIIGQLHRTIYFLILQMGASKKTISDLTELDMRMPLLIVAGILSLFAIIFILCFNTEYKRLNEEIKSKMENILSSNQHLIDSESNYSCNYGAIQ